MSVGWPRRISARSRPARATARGSRSAPVREWSGGQHRAAAPPCKERERLTLLEADRVRQAVQPVGRVEVIPRQQSVVRRGGEEHNVRAGVVLSLEAELALPARHASLDRDAVPDLPLRHPFADGVDLPSCLVSGVAGLVHNHVTDPAVFPEVAVAAADLATRGRVSGSAREAKVAAREEGGLTPHALT